MALGDIEIIGKPFPQGRPPKIVVRVDIVEPIDRLTRPVMHTETFDFLCNRAGLSTNLGKEIVSAFNKGLCSRGEMMTTFIRLHEQMILETGGTFPREMIQAGRGCR